MVLRNFRSMIIGSLAFVACLLLSIPGEVSARPLVRSIRSAHGTLLDINRTESILYTVDSLEIQPHRWCI